MRMRVMNAAVCLVSSQSWERMMMKKVSYQETLSTVCCCMMKMMNSSRCFGVVLMERVTASFLS